ncbi:MAG: ABC transporter substrate-binding protein [Defluviicoccus sp.]|nr:ABC transporter substrate-binding protein [Defluviicoccus sp.]MDE0384988.1 ABC transporter substrate-binding protein [Defluviicoccus sp.]
MALPGRLGRTVPLLLLLCAEAAPAAETNEPGVTGDRVAFAQSGCFSGACRAAGLRYHAGIRAAFHERNTAGGVRGRTLRLKSRDDAYDPVTAAANAERFAADRDVFAVIGGLGTPTALRMAPVLRRARVPFVGILSGAGFLRDRARFPNVVNLRTGYAEEARRLVAHMHGRRGARRFGVIYQDDAFGYSVLANYREALKALGLPVLAKASYSWHTHTIHGTLFVLEKADLDVVLMAATTSNVADAIDAARTFGHDFAFGMLSIVDLERIAGRLKSRFGPAVSTRVLPDVRDAGNALVKRFRSALAAWRAAAPEAAAIADAWSLEGYILGRFVIAVLERMPGAPNREGFLETALASGPFLIDGWKIAFADGRNAGSDYVRLVEFAPARAGDETGKAVD